METWEVLKIAGTIIGTISISGFSIWWFIQLAANTLADNYKKKIEHEFGKKIETYKSQLDVLKATALKYNDRQFELYIDLWKNLQDLKFATIDLWNEATTTNLKKFDLSLKQTHRQIETTSILLEENHYLELIRIITHLQEYDTGKEKLILSRRNNTRDYEIQQLIEFNKTRKDKCLEIIESMKTSIKLTIKGDKLQ
eukprot:TRINITY_DN58765_c0_g1_i1.p1 TRINITY_DN58765_c0_g1~~TRINITY_DN58765_c0_g1_i1.p1  ORF type:complete len:197 (+),score=31.36 TRINITY_DN58765_c0_g1_i1:155-745(+)